MPVYIARSPQCSCFPRFALRSRAAHKGALLALIGGLVFVATGCERQEEVRRYRIPKEHVLLRDNGPSPGEGGSEQSEVSYRMLAAIIPRDSQAWFFRLLGPAEAVQAQTADFRALVQSVHFAAGGTPEWKLPQGWEQKPASGMRHATIEIASSAGPLDLSVTVLPRNEPDQDTYTLSNVNRWRGQLGLAPLAPAQLKENVEPIELEGATATFVDLLGKKPQDNMSRAPFAGGAMPPTAPGALPPAGPAAGDAGPASAASASSRELTYDVPPTWTELAASGLRKASFSIGQNGEATIISLGAAGGVLLPNVNRWRQQIGLGEIQQEELDREAKKIEVSGLSGDLVELIGAEKAILGVVLQRGEQTWFFKLTGPPDLVTARDRISNPLCDRCDSPARRQSSKRLARVRHAGVRQRFGRRARLLASRETIQAASKTYGK